jgi:hypothetical protein
MTRIRRFWLTLPLFFLAATAAAQGPGDGASHIPIPPSGDTDPAKLFMERMKQTKLRGDLAGLLKQLPAGVGAALLPGQLEKQLKDNPELQDQLRKVLEGMNFDDPGTQERLKSLVGPDMARNLSPDVFERLRDFTKPPSATDPTGPAEAPLNRNPSRRNQPPSVHEPDSDHPIPDAHERAARQAWAKRVAEWAKRFPKDKLADPLRKSPALQDMLRNLSQAGADALRGRTGEGLEAQLAQWEGRWDALRDWLPNDWANDMARYVPNVPRPDIHLPDIHWTPPTIAPPAMPQLAAPAVDPGRLGSAAILILALALAAAVLWRWQSARTATPGRGWRRSLGPWPLDPESVGTRAEVIRAFEYLSLSRCGEEARSWHHRAIADRLGGTEAERQDAADQLAALYEHARYAPANLPEPDWTAAREPLTFLARTGAV